MKIRLTCEYQNEKGKSLGKYGDILESSTEVPAELLKRLVASGSAIELEPPKKSERD